MSCIEQYLHSSSRFFPPPGRNSFFAPLSLLLPTLDLTPGTDATSPGPENAAENHNHPVDPQHLKQLLPRHLQQLPIAVFPAVAHLEEFLGVIGDHAVDFAVDAPAHGLLVVDRPHVQGPVLGFEVSHEGGSERADEGLLEDVEGYVWEGEELAGVGD